MRSSRPPPPAIPSRPREKTRPDGRMCSFLRLAYRRGNGEGQKCNFGALTYGRGSALAARWGVRSRHTSALCDARKRHRPCTSHPPGILLLSGGSNGAGAEKPAKAVRLRDTREPKNCTFAPRRCRARTREAKSCTFPPSRQTPAVHPRRTATDHLPATAEAEIQAALGQCMENAENCAKSAVGPQAGRALRPPAAARRDAGSQSRHFPSSGTRAWMWRRRDSEAMGELWDAAPGPTALFAR